MFCRITNSNSSNSPFVHSAVKPAYGTVLPGVDLAALPGKLIVIEGTDGAGRSTQIHLLKQWLEQEGHAVTESRMGRSKLAGKGLQRAKQGNTLGTITLSLFYATDFVDRLENQIIPALEAGFVVLTDRYIYSLMARALARGLDPAWLRNAFRFALQPDAVFYLRIELKDLIPRTVFSHGFDYWESGQDLYPGEDAYESFCRYQTALLGRFDRLSQEYGFDVIDASQDVPSIFAHLRSRIGRILDPSPRKPVASISGDRLNGTGKFHMAAAGGPALQDREVSILPELPVHP